MRGRMWPDQSPTEQYPQLPRKLAWLTSGSSAPWSTSIWPSAGKEGNLIAHVLFGVDICPHYLSICG